MANHETTATSLVDGGGGGGVTKQETENHMKYNGFSAQNTSSKTPELNMWSGVCLNRPFVSLCVCVLLPHFPF